MRERTSCWEDSIKDFDGRIFVNGNTIVIKCLHCSCVGTWANELPGNWSMSHLCSRKDGLWAVIGQWETKLEDGQATDSREKRRKGDDR